MCGDCVTGWVFLALRREFRGVSWTGGCVMWDMEC